MERYFNDPTVASLAVEYNSLRSLAAHLECLAMRASSVNVCHRYTEPLWGDLESKSWALLGIVWESMMTHVRICWPTLRHVETKK